MPLLMDTVRRHRKEILPVRPRSVVPGRQRWEIGVVLGRPRVAEILETGLQRSPGVRAVRVNSRTGRLLVHHDPTLGAGEVGRLIRQAVVLAVRQAITLNEFLRAGPGTRTELRTRPTPERRPPRTVAPSAPTGSVAVVLTLTGGAFFRPCARAHLGGIVLTTVVVIQRP